MPSASPVDGGEMGSSCPRGICMGGGVSGAGEAGEASGPMPGSVGTAGMSTMMGDGLLVGGCGGMVGCAALLCPACIQHIGIAGCRHYQSGDLGPGVVDLAGVAERADKQKAQVNVIRKL